MTAAYWIMHEIRTEQSSSIIRSEYGTLGCSFIILYTPTLSRVRSRGFVHTNGVGACVVYGAAILRYKTFTM